MFSSQATNAKDKVNADLLGSKDSHKELAKPALTWAELVDSPVLINALKHSISTVVDKM